MSAPIETDWITDADPAREGVYQRKHDDGRVLFHRWTGLIWMAGETTAELARKMELSSLFQERRLPWRGIVPEVLGCIPVEADAENTCRGCYFLNNCECAAACGAVNCSEESIIWRPRAEVQA